MTAPILPEITLKDKPKYLKLGENIDFLRLFELIQSKYETCFILESLSDNSYESRYSVIGFDPEGEVVGEEDSLKFFNYRGKNSIFGENFVEEEVEIKSKNPYFDLQKITPTNIISKKYAGGLVGYLTYETANLIEPNLNLPTHEKFDLFRFGIYTDGLVLDKFTGEIFYFYYKENRLELVQSFLTSTESTSNPQLSANLYEQSLVVAPKINPQLSAKVDPLEGVKGGVRNQDIQVKFLGNSKSEEEHEKDVLTVIEEIKAGNTFQCEVGFKSLYEIKGNKFKIYERIREVNPSPYMYFLKFGGQVMIGASPELLFRLSDGQMETFPLAGSAPRGKTKEEDLDLTKKLLNDPKEVAEHLMLVDMHRNDLGKVAKFATVKVRRLMDVVKYSHVQHISSEITGILAGDQNMFTGLASVFPGGVLNGSPKVESIKIIHRNEKAPRGVYGGGIGHFGFNGDCTFCIPIRSLFTNNEFAYIQTSSGIVFDSKPKKEYQEIIHKLSAMKKVLDELSEK